MGRIYKKLLKWTFLTSFPAAGSGLFLFPETIMNIDTSGVWKWLSIQIGVFLENADVIFQSLFYWAPGLILAFIFLRGVLRLIRGVVRFWNAQKDQTKTW